MTTYGDVRPSFVSTADFFSVEEQTTLLLRVGVDELVCEDTPTIENRGF